MNDGRMIGAFHLMGSVQRVVGIAVAGVDGYVEGNVSVYMRHQSFGLHIFEHHGSLERRCSVIVARCPANVLEHEPCGFLRHADIGGQLKASNQFLSVVEVHGREPFAEREFALAEYGADTDGEHSAAFGTTIPLAATVMVDLPIVRAVRAKDAGRSPSGLRQPLFADFLGSIFTGEPLDATHFRLLLDC